MNIHEEYSRKEEMKVLENKNDVQKEELYETSKRMDYDNTNGDKIVENKGTNEPTGIIQQKNPRKRFYDEVLERIKSEEIFEEVRINDTTRDDTCLDVKNTEDEYNSEPNLFR